MTTNKPRGSAFVMVLLAFITWGLTPLYFKWLDQVSAVELVVHRIIWSAVFLWLLLVASGLASEFFRIWKDARLRNGLLITSVLITGNWLIFVYAVITGQAVEASLGYYINPLVSIALAGVFLGERLSRVQWCAVIMVSCGVIAEIWTLGSVSWIACTLALSFAVYGLLRKKLIVNPMAALAAETTWMFPIAFVVLVYGQQQLSFVFIDQAGTFMLPLMLAGIVTVIPLLLYVSGLPGVTLTMAGFAQYIAPSMVFVLAVTVFDEPLSPQRLWTFGLIWAALILVSLEGVMRWRTSVQK